MFHAPARSLRSALLCKWSCDSWHRCYWICEISRLPSRYRTQRSLDPRCRLISSGSVIPKTELTGVLGETLRRASRVEVLCSSLVP
jgi:hypothetical protein